MNAATLDRIGRKIETEEKTNFFIIPADKMVQGKPLELYDFDIQQITVSGTFIDATPGYMMQWYATKPSSMANPSEVLEYEIVLSVPHQPSEDELLDSWEKYLEEHWDNLVAQHEGEYVAIWNGEVYDSDKDLAALADRVYANLGYRPIFMPYIGKQRKVAEFLSPV
jgi:hypothetical protein